LFISYYHSESKTIVQELFYLFFSIKGKLDKPLITHSKLVLYAVIFKTRFQVVLFLVDWLAVWQRSLKIHGIVEILFGKYCLEVI